MLVLSDDSGGGAGGEPIVMEHTLPQSTTLQAALQRQLGCDHKYGTSYIAECRIIPELTRDV